MRIDGLIKNQASDLAGLMDTLGRLEIGDVIKAKVLEMTSGEIMLKLFDGSVFKAEARAEINAKPGDMVDFRVAARDEGRVFLEVAQANGKSPANLQNDLKKALLELKLDTGPQNISLAEEFKAAGIKMTAALFEKAAELMEKLPDITSDKAVFAASKGIEPEAVTEGTLFKLLEGKFKLGSQFSELERLLDDALKSIGKNSGKPLEPGSVMKADSSAAGGNSKTNAPNTVDLAFTRQPDSGIPTKTNIQINIGNEVSAFYQSSSDDSPKNMKGLQNQSIKSSNIGKTAALPMSPIDDASPVSDNSDKVTKSSENPANSWTNKNTAMDMLADDVLGKAEFRGETSVIFKGGGNLKGDNISGDDLFVKNAVDPKDMQGEPGIAAKAPLNTQMDTEFKSEKLHVLKKAIEDTFVKIDSGSLDSDLDAKKLYKGILEKLDSIREFVQHTDLPGRTEITSRITGIQEGIRFLDQLNTALPYVQIPLNMAGFNTTGELYAMARDHKRKRLDPRNLVMFISLDTQNIGRIESIVDIKEKNVAINLSAENKSVLDFIKENMKQLYNGLFEKGYKLVDIRYRLMDEALKPFNVERKMKKGLEEESSRVDMRI